MAYTIFFATSTGKTEDVADKLKELLPGTESKDVDSIGSAAELAEAEALICCVPTWNTGADEGRSGTAWDTYAEEIPSMDFSGKSVAILGLVGRQYTTLPLHHRSNLNRKMNLQGLKLLLIFR